MRKTRKVLSSVVTAAIVAIAAIPAIPAVPVLAAPSPLVTYSFEGDTGMSASGISGATAPSVANDSERGNVLKFATGSTSQIKGKVQDASMGEYDMKIDPGTPSSLKFDNPFKGKSLNGISVAMWVKCPSEDAAVNGSGLVGFVSGNKTLPHPDKETGDPNKQDLSDGTGPFAYGITTAYADAVKAQELPMVYFAGLHHNSYNCNDTKKVFKETNVWKYMVVSMTNSSATIYIDGVDIEADDTMPNAKNKRWNHGEINGGSTGNTTQPLFTEMISWADTQGYVGYTGFSPTYDGVCIDDLSFFSTALSAAEVSALYSSAKSGTVQGSGSTGSTSAEAKKQAEEAKQAAKAEAEAAAAAQEAAAQEENKNLTNAIISSVDVSGMPSTATKSVTGIFRGESAYTDLQSKINSVTLRSGYRMANVVGMDINFGGLQPEALATITMNVPEGFDTSKMELVRVNDDGTVSILKYTIENGKIVTKTNHFSTFAIVELEQGVYSGKTSSNLPKTGVVSTGIVVVFGALLATGGAVILKKRKSQEA